MFADRIAHRYARALFEAARDRDRLEDTWQGLQAVQRLADEIPDLREWLAHPRIPGARKKALLRDLLGPAVEALVVDFLGLLVDKERCAALDGVIAEFQRLRDESQGRVPARVTTALALTEEERAALRSRLQEWTGAAEIELREEVDSSLLGGAIVQVQGRLIDGSVRSRLAELRERLKRVRVT
jgi:F-type H+-transporting ATPase subunit delta